jgi:GGDEF domain-containing protein
MLSAVEMLPANEHDLYRGPSAVSHWGRAIEACDRSEAMMTARLHHQLAQLNSTDARSCLSLSSGAARFDPRSETSVKQLIARADRAMYGLKRPRAAAGPYCGCST